MSVRVIIDVSAQKIISEQLNTNDASNSIVAKLYKQMSIMTTCNSKLIATYVNFAQN